MRHINRLIEAADDACDKFLHSALFALLMSATLVAYLVRP